MEQSMFLCMLLVIAWTHIHGSLGSEVKLTAAPKTITRGLTENLKLRCSLQDTATQGVVVGRQISSIGDLQHVNSIIVSKVDNDESVTALAQIIMSENAKVLNSAHQLNAIGTLTPGDPADPEYIELTWTNPGQDQSGNYICEVNGLDLQGHSVMLKSGIAVDIVDPDVEDLVQEINTLKAILSTLKAPHNEQGTVACGNSDTWTVNENNAKQIVKSVTFKQPYASPPTVVVVAAAEAADTSTNIERYNIHTNAVTTTGFEAVCGTWANSHINNLNIQWYSFVA